MLHTSCIHRAGLFSIGLANAAIYASQLCHCGIDACTGVVYSPFSVIAISGFISRLITIPLTIYGDKCLSRLARALPELYDAHNDFDYVNKHPRAISWEKRVAAEKLSSERDRIWAEYKTNNMKTILPYWIGWGLLWGLCQSCGSTLYSFYTYIHQLNMYSPLSFALICHTTASSSTSEVTSLASFLSSNSVCVNSNGSLMTYIVNSWSALWDVLVHVKLNSISLISSHGLMEQCTTNTATISTTSLLSSSLPPPEQLCIVLGFADPTLCLAASLTLWSTLIHLRSRVGFNARMDRFVKWIRRWVWRGWMVCVASSVCYAPCISCLQTIWSSLSYLVTYVTTSNSLFSSSQIATAASTLVHGSTHASNAFTGLTWMGNAFIPSYVVAFWAGAAVCMLLKQYLINSNIIGRKMCGIQPYPSTHGQYGNTTTNDGLLVLWDQGQEAVEERSAQWAKQRVAYEYECDLRIHRLLRQCGLFNEEEDAILELERVKERRQRLSERKVAEHETNQNNSKSNEEMQHTNVTHNKQKEEEQELYQKSTQANIKLHRPRRAWEINDVSGSNSSNSNVNTPMSANVGNIHVNTTVEELEQIIEEQRAIQERKYDAFLQPTNEYEEKYKALKRASKERVDQLKKEKKEELHEELKKRDGKFN